jgi:hypothetical protein
MNDLTLKLIKTFVNYIYKCKIPQLKRDFATFILVRRRTER